MTQTPIDQAHAAMEAADAPEAAQLRFYERLADSELFLLLEAEAKGDQITPDLFQVQDGTFALAFDREERLAEFAGRIVPYAALPGRVLVRMLSAQGIGMGVNLGVAPSSTLLPPEALAWLTETLDAAPGMAEVRPVAFFRPRTLPETLLQALDEKLARAGGLAQDAWLAEVEYESGAKGHLLAFTGTSAGAEQALAQAINEALVFSGLEAGSLDVTFLQPEDKMAAKLSAVALRFELPVPPVARPAPIAPGSDPEKPPRLR